MLEVKALKEDVGKLQAELVRLTDEHQYEVSNLQRELQNCTGVMKQAMDSLTKQMAEQASCLVRACQTRVSDKPG